MKITLNMRSIAIVGLVLLQCWFLGMSGSFRRCEDNEQLGFIKIRAAEVNKVLHECRNRLVREVIAGRNISGTEWGNMMGVGYDEDFSDYPSRVRVFPESGLLFLKCNCTEGNCYSCKVIDRIPKKALSDIANHLGQTLVWEAPGKFHWEGEGVKLDFKAKDSAGDTLLHRSAKLAHDYSQYVVQAIKDGFDINTRNNNGQTVLQIALEAGNVSQMVPTLMSNNANIKIKDNNDNTTIHAATIGNKKEFINDFVQKGVDINALNKDGKTALFIAVESKKNDVARELMERKAKVSIVDKNKNTLLHTAVNVKNNDIINDLIKNGVDINAQNNGGDTVLLMAVKNNDKGLVESLPKAGLNLNIKDADGNTALHIAASYEQKNTNAMALLLKNMGADLKATNKQGKMPYELAYSYELHKLLKP